MREQGSGWPRARAAAVALCAACALAAPLAAHAGAHRHQVALGDEVFGHQLIEREAGLGRLDVFGQGLVIHIQVDHRGRLGFAADGFQVAANQLFVIGNGHGTRSFTRGSQAWRPAGSG